MSLRITDACVRCGACLWECPEQAIVPGRRRPDVVADECTECWGHFADPQCAVVCPADALVTVEEGLDVLAERFHRRRPGVAPRDTDVWRPAPG